MPTRPTLGSAKAPNFIPSVRPDTLAGSYHLECAPDQRCHVIPDGVPFPHASVWHRESNTVYYMRLSYKARAAEASREHRADTEPGILGGNGIDGIDGTNEDHVTKLPEWDLITHNDGRVTFRVTDKMLSQWMTTPDWITFDTKDLPAYLKHSARTGVSVPLDAGTAHIRLLPDETREFLEPQFIGDPDGQKRRHLEAMLRRCQGGHSSWHDLEQPSWGTESTRVS